MKAQHPHPIRETPYRSPQVVSETVRDVIQDKTVCELGCAEGDNMIFMSEYAKRVLGMELNEQRYRFAKQRNLEVIVGDYHRDSLPKADVYYFWPDDGESDNEKLVRKILANKDFHGTIIVGGDTAMPSEVASVNRCAKLGKLVEVPYNEGKKHRQSGIFLLAIIEADDARRSNEKKVSSGPKFA